MRFIHLFRRVAFVACVCLSYIAAVAQSHRAVIISAYDEAPVANVSITLFDNQRCPTDSLTSSADGDAIISDNARFLLAEHDEYASRLFELSGQPIDTIRLTPATMIDEVVVKGSTMTDHHTYVSHIIPREDMKRYTNFYLSLNEIPGIAVMQGGELYMDGNPKVALMLNGVETTVEELRAIDKDDILKINTYRTPPARLIAQGYRSAIDVITKSSLSGGNASVDINQYFYPLKGNNSASFFYNYKRSRFSLMYNNSNKHNRKFRQSEFLDYEFDDVIYYKHKQGLDSHSNDDDNNIYLGFQNNLPGSYLYNLKIGAGISRHGKDLRQLVSSESVTVPYDASNSLYTSSENINISNYFEKSFGESGKYGTIVANVTWQKINSGYQSSYQEFANGGNIPSVNERSAYNIRYDAVLTNLQYVLPNYSWGTLSVSLYENYMYSKYKETGVSTSQRVNAMGALAMYYGWKGNFQYTASIGIEGRYTDAESAPNSYSIWRPTPRVGLYYIPRNNLWFYAGYSYTVENPTIAQLSQTDQWLDTRLVFHGNPDLHPYQNHYVQVQGNWNTRYFECSLHGSYSSSPGWICNHFVKAADYMLETVVNLDRFEELGGGLTLGIKPFGNNSWVIYNRIFGGKMRGRSVDYNWDGYRFQWMPWTEVNLDKWHIYASYQFPGKVCQGQLIRPRTQSWGVGCEYRPMENMAVGLYVESPFGKGWKESERTVASSPVQENTELYVRDMANAVAITFSWNMAFGKKHITERPRFTQSLETDGGILTK